MQGHSPTSQRFATTILLWAMLQITCSALGESVMYTQYSNLHARGSFIESDDGLFRVIPDEVVLDLNRNGEPDLLFRHAHVPRSKRVDADAVELLRAADVGLVESLQIVKGLRQIAISSAKEGVNDKDALVQNQSQIDNALLTIDRIARYSGFKGRRILDGSLGFETNSSNPLELAGISATAETAPGDYTINVTSPARRATVEARLVQTSGLSQDETMVLNGVGLELNKGMTQVQVVDRINDFTHQTGVIADNSSPSGATRLYSERFGADALVRVITNRFAAVDSSGFGWTYLTSPGTDLEASIGPNTYTGNGQTIFATGGSEKGLVVRVEPSMVDPTVTVTGNLGAISVVDQSPAFILGDSQESLSLPNIRPTALGQGISGNQFVSLADIKVLTARQANDALSIIDTTIDDLRSFSYEVSDFLALNAYPYGVGTIETLGGAGFLLQDDGSLLPAGVRVGPQSEFEDGVAWLQDSSVFQALRQSGFVGVRASVSGGWVYGWIGLQVENDSSIRITDAAWNTVMAKPVYTAVTPEPKFNINTGILLLLAVLSRRRRSASLKLVSTH